MLKKNVDIKLRISDVYIPKIGKIAVPVGYTLINGGNSLGNYLCMIFTFGSCLLYAFCFVFPFLGSFLFGGGVRGCNGIVYVYSVDS